MGTNSPNTSLPALAPVNSAAYRFWRGVIRLWFTLTFRRIRVLHEERLIEAGPALLIATHPESFLDAIILVAALKRPVQCVIHANSIKGLLAPLLARGLGMITFAPQEGNSAIPVEQCCSVLGDRGILATFLEPGPARLPGGNEIPSMAASIAVEAESRNSGQLQIQLFPIHIFLPVTHTHTSDVLIDVDKPESAHEYLSDKNRNPSDQTLELTKALEGRCRVNSFQLQPDNLANFLADVEEALRNELQENWGARPAWKQRSEGFELSRFVVEWAKQTNYMHPGRLVSLRQSLDAWRWARRRWSLHCLEVEGAGGWSSGPLGRGVVWIETVAGFAIALYGLVNHLPAIAVLYLTGLMRKESKRDKIMEWIARGLILVGWYAGAIFLVAHTWGRRAAGYYAPTLPLSALYLWRYAWLLQHQTRVMVLSLRVSAEAAKAKRLRKDFLHEMNDALDWQAEMLGLPH